MKRAAILAAALAGALATPASAATLTLPDGAARPEPYQTWADSAKVPVVDGTITLTLTECAGVQAGACATPGNIWLLPGLGFADPDPRSDRAALWHELGHQFDYVVLTDADRTAFRALIDDVRSWRASPNSPHEQFAEAYRWCALNPRPHRLSRWALYKYGYHPSRRVHGAACAMINAHAQG